MIVAAKPFTLAGRTFAPGQVIPHDHWDAQTRRTREALTSIKWVKYEEAAPAAPEAKRPAPRKRGRPRKRKAAQ